MEKTDQMAQLNDLRNPPSASLQRALDRLQLAVSAMEFAAYRLDAEIRVCDAEARITDAAALHQIAGQLRDAVAEATAKPAPVEPRDFLQQPD